MSTPDTEVQRIFEEIKKLEPADRIRLAADLLERQRPALALSLLERTVAELRALKATGSF